MGVKSDLKLGGYEKVRRGRDEGTRSGMAKAMSDGFGPVFYHSSRSKSQGVHCSGELDREVKARARKK